MQDPAALELETGCKLKHRSWQEVNKSFDSRPSEAAAVVTEVAAAAIALRPDYPDSTHINDTSTEAQKNQEC